MAKLYYRYGAMDSSKSANLIMVAHNYEKQGRRVVCLKPSVDNRFGENFIVSRSGIKAPCFNLTPKGSVFDIIKRESKKDMLHCVLVDEAQFLSHRQVLELVEVADVLNIPVIAYGLKNSYVPGTLFEGSAALLYYADSIEEIKTICAFCDKKATMNLRIVGGQPVYSGDLVVIGDTAPESGGEYFLPTCRRHYLKPPLKGK